MEKLTQMLIEKGLEHWFSEARPDKSVAELAEYSGEKELIIMRVKSKDYTPILKLENVEYLTVTSRKEVKAIYDQLTKLPKLKYGTLIEHPELFRS